MRTNVYAEETTDRIELISKEIDGREYVGLRFYLELPASFVSSPTPPDNADGERPATVHDAEQAKHYRAPFIHRPGDDDSSAVTFWGKQELRGLLEKGVKLLDEHYKGASNG